MESEIPDVDVPEPESDAEVSAKMVAFFHNEILVEHPFHKVAKQDEARWNRYPDMPGDLGKATERENLIGVQKNSYGTDFGEITRKHLPQKLHGTSGSRTDFRNMKGGRVTKKANLDMVRAPATSINPMA